MSIFFTVLLFFYISFLFYKDRGINFFFHEFIKSRFIKISVEDFYYSSINNYNELSILYALLYGGKYMLINGVVSYIDKKTIKLRYNGQHVIHISDEITFNMRNVDEYYNNSVKIGDRITLVGLYPIKYNKNNNNISNFSFSYIVKNHIVLSVINIYYTFINFIYHLHSEESITEKEIKKSMKEIFRDDKK